MLEARCRAPTTALREFKRARIVLLAAEGRSTRGIAREVDVEPRVMSTWRHRFADHGLEGLVDKPKPGKLPIYGEAANKRILALLEQPPPKGYARWRRLATSMCNMSGASFAPRRSTSPDANPGARATILSSSPRPPMWSGSIWRRPRKRSSFVSTKRIQALERSQGYLKLPNGRALTGHSHDYKRNGTSTLFAAFEVATGKVTAAHKTRRRRVEFLDFMNNIVGDKDIRWTSSPASELLGSGPPIADDLITPDAHNSAPSTTRRGWPTWVFSRHAFTCSFLAAYDALAAPPFWF